MSIAIVGNVNLDVKTSPIPAEERLFSDGETSIAEIYDSIGGGGANTAVAAATMGGRVALCAAIGDDALGERLRAYLVARRVEPLLAVKPARTGRSLALNWDRRQRHFFSCLPSSLLLDAADVDLAALAAGGVRHLYRADVWFAPRMLAQGNLQLFQQARSLGLDVSIDINWDPHWSAGRDDPAVCNRIEAVRRTLSLATYAHGNERELCFFAGLTTRAEAARWFFDQGVGGLIVHRGAQGSAALAPDGNVVEVPAASAPRTVNEAGTGDVFTAAFLLRDGTPMPQRLSACNAIAAQHLAGEVQYLPAMD